MIIVLSRPELFLGMEMLLRQFSVHGLLIKHLAIGMKWFGETTAMMVFVSIWLFTFRSRKLLGPMTGASSTREGSHFGVTRGIPTASDSP